VRLVHHRLHVLHHHGIALVPGAEAVLPRHFVGFRIEVGVELLHPVRGLTKVATERHPFGCRDVQTRTEGSKEGDAESPGIQLAETA
jgi:hypothetical protein